MNEEYFEDMDIYTEKGSKVKYMASNGDDFDVEQANKYLVKGQVYTVKDIIVGSWSSRVSLEEVADNQWFNTVMFMNVED